MRKLLLLFIATLVMAKVHTAKVEPYEIYTYKAAAAAQVVDSQLQKEGKEVADAPLIKLDDRVDRAKLDSLRSKLAALKKTIQITQQNIHNAQKIAQIKKSNYDRIKNLKSKSLSEKERKLSEYLSARSTYLNLLEKLQNLKIQKADLEYALAATKDQIEKKNPRFSGYVYKIHAKKGDFAAIGSPLVDIADVSRAKAVVYLGPEELEGIERKKIYIDGKPSDARFEVIEKITDPDYITQYRAKIVLPKPPLFGKFIQVEIK